jgi:hypothetical protein
MRGCVVMIKEERKGRETVLPMQVGISKGMERRA